MDGGSGNELQRKSTPPQRICNFTVQELSKIVGLEGFVDKTLFIKAFLEDIFVVIVALAPRRFMKSTNMDMIKEFVSGNKNLFINNELKIWKEETEFFNKYCEKNPVKCVGGDSIDELLDKLRDVIKDAFKAHRYLINDDGKNISWSDQKLMAVGRIGEYEMYWKNPSNLSKNHIQKGLKDLSECLNVYHGKPVYVFMDEYDAPIMKAIVNNVGDEVVKKTIQLIGELMSTLFKNNKYLKKGLINACVRISQVLSADANNIVYYEFLREPTFSPYFGFTDKEVDSLFEKTEFAELKNDKVKLWYNSYKLIHTDEYMIYSSHSVLNYLVESKKNGKPMFDTYWADSGSINYLQHLFAETKIRTYVERLIDEEQVEIKTIKKISKQDIITLKSLVNSTLEGQNDDHARLFLQFLTENGCLNVVAADPENRKATIVAPNKAIITLLKQKCYRQDLIQTKYRLSSENIGEFIKALELVLQQRGKNEFIKFATAVSILFGGKALMPKNETELHNILFTLMYCYKEFNVSGERKVVRQKRSSSRLDILVIYDEVGMIIEPKFKDKSSEEAHTQAVGYGKVFEDSECSKVKVKIFAGVHMTEDGNVSVTYSVDSLPEQTVTSSD